MSDFVKYNVTELFTLTVYNKQGAFTHLIQCYEEIDRLNKMITLKGGKDEKSNS